MIVDREVHKKMLLVLEGLLHLEETCEAKRKWRRKIEERMMLALEDKIDLEDGERRKVRRLLGIKE